MCFHSGCDETGNTHLAVAGVYVCLYDDTCLYWRLVDLSIWNLVYGRVSPMGEHVQNYVVLLTVLAALCYVAYRISKLFRSSSSSGSCGHCMSKACNETEQVTELHQIEFEPAIRDNV